MLISGETFELKLIPIFRLYKTVALYLYEFMDVTRPTKMKDN